MFKLAFIHIDATIKFVFMKIITSILFTFLCTVSLAGVIIIEGSYQNQNIYVKNAYRSAGIGFCAYQVKINGSVSTDEVNSTAFEIDLTQYQLEQGAPLSIEIVFNDDGCVPMVLNPNALTPNPTFETISIDIDDNGLLEWNTINETASLPFVIEQFKWNKWVKVGEVQGKGTPKKHTYYFKTYTHSGNNKFRVKQKGFIDKTIHSPSVSYQSLKSEVTYVYNKKHKNIEFSEETSYEVYDKFGELVKKGFDKKFSMHNLKNDTYYMNYGNTTCELKKR